MELNLPEASRFNGCLGFVHQPNQSIEIAMAIPCFTITVIIILVAAAVVAAVVVAGAAGAAGKKTQSWNQKEDQTPHNEWKHIFRNSSKKKNCIKEEEKRNENEKRGR